MLLLEIKKYYILSCLFVLINSKPFNGNGCSCGKRLSYEVETPVLTQPYQPSYMDYMFDIDLPQNKPIHKILKRKYTYGIEEEVPQITKPAIDIYETRDLVKNQSKGDQLSASDDSLNTRYKRKNRPLYKTQIKKKNPKVNRRYKKVYKTELPKKSSTPLEGSENKKRRNVGGSRLKKRDIQGEYKLIKKDEDNLDLTLPEIIQFVPEMRQPNFKTDFIGCQASCVDKMEQISEKLSRHITETEVPTITATTTEDPNANKDLKVVTEATIGEQVDSNKIEEPLKTNEPEIKNPVLTNIVEELHEEQLNKIDVENVMLNNIEKVMHKEQLTSNNAEIDSSMLNLPQTITYQNAYQTFLPIYGHPISLPVTELSTLNNANNAHLHPHLLYYNLGQLYHSHTSPISKRQTEYTAGVLPYADPYRQNEYDDVYGRLIVNILSQHPDFINSSAFRGNNYWDYVIEQNAAASRLLKAIVEDSIHTFGKKDYL